MIALDIREEATALMRNCAKWRALFRELLHGCLAITILVKQRLKESKKAISQGNNSAVLASVYLSAKENQINLVNRLVKILNHPPSKDSLPWEAIKLSAESVLFWNEPTVPENQMVKKKKTQMRLSSELEWLIQVPPQGSFCLSEGGTGVFHRYQKVWKRDKKGGIFSHTTFRSIRLARWLTLSFFNRRFTSKSQVLTEFWHF